VEEMQRMKHNDGIRENVGAGREFDGGIGWDEIF
jgi:hypothetical protein